MGGRIRTHLESVLNFKCTATTQNNMNKCENMVLGNIQCDYLDKVSGMCYKFEHNENPMVVVLNYKELPPILRKQGF